MWLRELDDGGSPPLKLTLLPENGFTTHQMEPPCHGYRQWNNAPPRISTESIPRGTRSGIAMHYHGKAIANNTVIEVSYRSYDGLNPFIQKPNRHTPR